MLSLKSCLQGYGSSTPLDTARDRCRNGARLDWLPRRRSALRGHLDRRNHVTTRLITSS